MRSPIVVLNVPFSPGLGKQNRLLCRRGGGRVHGLEFCHGGLGEVAEVAVGFPFVPFVVLLDENRSSEPEKGNQVGKTPTKSVRHLSSLLTRSRGLVDQTRRQYLVAKRLNASRSSLA